MTAHRVYIASESALALEKRIGADGRYQVLGGSGRAEDAIRSGIALQPDCAVLDMHLAGGDAFSVLEAWRRAMAAPPRVLVRCPYSGDGWKEKLQKAGADRVAGAGEDEMALLLETAETPLPALAAPDADTRREIARGLLDRLGMARGLKGYRYILEAASALCCAPQLGDSLAGRLYPYLAEKFDTTPGAVERAVRTAAEDTWLRGDWEEIQTLFGLTVDPEKGKPTNAELLSMLAEHARREMRRHLTKAGGFF